MKRILIFILIIASISSYGQAPNTILQGAPSTLYKWRGPFGTDSALVFATNFSDTNVVNLGWIKGIPGAVIRTGDTLRMRNSTADAWITVGIGSGGGGGSGVNLYNADSSLASDRTVDMNGKMLNFSVNGESFLHIDPTLNSERTWIEAFNSGGLNKGFSEVRSTDVDAHFRLLADFHDGDAQAIILGQSESGVSSIIYTADTHTFAGNVLLSNLANGGTRGLSVNSSGTIIASNDSSSEFSPSSAFIAKITNSTPVDTFVAKRNGGLREFDIQEAHDSSHDYEMFYTNLLTATRYVRFHSPSQLQAALGGPTDVQVKSGYLYPSYVVFDGRYFVTGYQGNSPGKGNYIYYGATISELQAATPTLMIGIDTIAFDISIRPNPAGGFMASGNISGVANVWTAPTPLGPWTARGPVFSSLLNGQSLYPTYTTSMADEYIFSNGDNIYLMYNGLPTANLQYPHLSHEVIVHLDPTTFQPKSKAIEMFHCRDLSMLKTFVSGDSVQAAANPVYVNIQGRNELWFVWSKADTGWISYYQIGSKDSLSGLNGYFSQAKVVPGVRTDIASNLLHNFYGSVANNDSGIVATATSSGMWNFIPSGNLVESRIHVQFALSSLPSVGDSATIFKLTPNSPANTRVTYSVNSSGVQVLRYTNAAGVSTNFTITGTVSVGVKTDLDLIWSFTAGTIIANSGTSSSQTFTSATSIGECTMYSLMNDSCDGFAPAHQMLGTIYSFSINLIQDTRTEAIPANQIAFGAGGVTGQGLTSSSDLTFDDPNNILKTNTNLLLSSTTINPYVSYYTSGTYTYGTGLNFKSAIVGLGNMIPSDAEFNVVSYTAGALPANQAALTKRFEVLGSGVIRMPSITNAVGTKALRYDPATGNVTYTDTATLLSQWTTTGSNIYYNTGSVGIGNTGPAASALLELTSTTKGFLPPRMNTTQQNAISSPATGLLIWNSDSSLFRFFNGSAWATIAAGSGGGGTTYTFSTGLTNTSSTITADLSTGVSGGQTAIGGTGVTDVLSLKGTTANATTTVAGIKFLVGNNGATTAMQIFNNGNVGIGSAPSATTRLRATGSSTSNTDYSFYGENSSSANTFSVSNSGIVTAGISANANNTSFLSLGKSFFGGSTTPTSVLMIRAGTATANTAPFKLTVSGAVILTTPEAGVVEVNSSGELFYSSNTSASSRGYVQVNRYIAKTGTYTATADDETIDCTSGTFTVTLPTAVGIAGRRYTVVNSGSGTITIGTTSSQTFVNINATPTTLTMGAVGAAAIVSYTLESNGANWIAVAKVKNE